jgi:hypothetical protein
MKEETTLIDNSSIEIVTITEWRRSDCCFAKVTQHHEIHQESEEPFEHDLDEDGNANWTSVSFICNLCGNDCATYTSAPLARLAAQVENKVVEDDT